MNLKCQVVNKISKKGNNYECLEISFSDNYKKVVYLEAAEVELLKLCA